MEVRGQSGGHDPVAEALVPRGRRELSAQDRGEVIIAKLPSVRYLPTVFFLEMVGEADKVVARLAVGAHDLLGLQQAIRPVGVAVKVAAVEAAPPSVLEQV
jgi:hypothetical protein